MGTEQHFIGTSFATPVHKMEEPPASYISFVDKAADTFVEKSTDYDHRFLRALVTHDAATLWAWEIDKKLDRLRTWLRRGELQVKGEGLRNSIDDLFIYTVQYLAYLNDVQHYKVDPGTFLEVWTDERRSVFIEAAKKMQPKDYVGFFISRGRIEPHEAALQEIVRLYLGDDLQTIDWQRAIRALLSK